MKVTIPVDFDITADIKDTPMVLQINWLEANKEGFKVDLTCGAGLGNAYIKSHAQLAGDSLYAVAHIGQLAQTLFAELESRLRGEET